MIVPKSIRRVSYEGKELAGSRPTMTCEVALMLGKGKSQGSICPSHDLNLKSVRLVKILKQARAAVKDEPWKELGYDGEVDDILDNISGDPENKPLFKQLLMSSQGLEYVLGIVAQVRYDADTGEVSAELLEQLADICGGDWESAPEKSACLARLDRGKERLERLKKKIERVEAEDRAARLRSALLLDPRKPGGATALYRRQRKASIPGRGATGATAETKERRGCSASNRCAGN